MTKVMLRPGDGERRVDARFELACWADVRRANGEDAGKVLVTDASRAGFNMQSRWDLAPGEHFQIDIAPLNDCRAKVVWHDSSIGSYGCRFDRFLSEIALDQILSFAADLPEVLEARLPQHERRGQPRFTMHVPVIARRNEAIEREVVIFTNLSNSGFRMRSGQSYDLKQTVFIELGDNLLTEARIVRFDKVSSEYGGRFLFALAPALIDRLISVYADTSAHDRRNLAPPV